MNGRCKHLEHKIWFLIINQVQPTLFLRNLSFVKFKGDLATETNEDNDFTKNQFLVPGSEFKKKR